MGLALAVGAALILFTTTSNVFTLWHDNPDIPRWQPLVWEYSSALGGLISLVIPWLAVRAAWPGSAPWPTVIGVHATASLAFSAVHVGLFLMLRTLAYAVVGERYVVDLSLSEFAYEYGKDLLGYAICVGLLWLFPRSLPRQAAPEPTTLPPSVTTYAIRDSAKLIRTPVSDIIAARSAGNYVEFLLADGSRPLARATLAAVERDLEASGFVRTHRSWLVNTARVRRLSPEGSGDFAIDLEGAVTVPLSRRFPTALSRLRT